MSYRLPLAMPIVESPAFSDSGFLGSLMYMTDYSFFMPYMEDNQRWMKALYQTVCSVENGSGTPEEMARMFGSDIENERKD